MQTINFLDVLLREQLTAQGCSLPRFLRRLEKQVHISLRLKALQGQAQAGQNGASAQQPNGAKAEGNETADDVVDADFTDKK